MVIHPRAHRDRESSVGLRPRRGHLPHRRRRLPLRRARAERALVARPHRSVLLGPRQHRAGAVGLLRHDRRPGHRPGSRRSRSWWRHAFARTCGWPPARSPWPARATTCSCSPRSSRPRRRSAPARSAGCDRATSRTPRTTNGAMVRSTPSSGATRCRDNVAYTNLRNIFDDVPADQDVFLDSYHFGDRGNDLIARAMAQALLAPTEPSRPPIGTRHDARPGNLRLLPRQRRGAACVTARSSPPPRRSASRRQQARRAFPATPSPTACGRRRPIARTLDYVAFYEKPLAKFDRLLRDLPRRTPREGYQSFRMAMPVWLGQSSASPARSTRHLQSAVREGQYVFPEHHESHAASAFYPVAVRRGGHPDPRRRRRVGHGHHRRRARATDIELPQRAALPALARPALLGVHLLLRVQGQQRRVQADGPGALRRAAVPRPHPRAPHRPARRRLVPDGHGVLQLLPGPDDDLAGVRRALRRPAARSPSAPLTQREMDLAASIQAVTEEIVLRCGRHVHREHRHAAPVPRRRRRAQLRRQRRLLREGPFDDIWIQPAAGDAGGALGRGAASSGISSSDTPREPRPRDASRARCSARLLGRRRSSAFLDGAACRYTQLRDRRRAAATTVAELPRRAARWSAGSRDGWSSGRARSAAARILGDAARPARCSRA